MWLTSIPIVLVSTYVTVVELLDGFTLISLVDIVLELESEGQDEVESESREDYANDKTAVGIN